MQDCDDVQGNVLLVLQFLRKLTLVLEPLLKIPMWVGVHSDASQLFFLQEVWREDEPPQEDIIYTKVKGNSTNYVLHQSEGM